MTFKNGREMLNELESSDLYNAEKELYVFSYNSAGSIAVYHITNEKAEELRKDSKEYGEYWGGLLGPGGCIWDDPSYDGFEEGHYTNLDWCNDNYSGEWEDVSVEED